MDVVAETPVETPSEAPVESSGGEVESSLAEHEAQFGKEARRNAPMDREAGEETGSTPGGVDKDPATGRFRQRARSQQATPRDVEQISELTRQLRQAESDLGLKIEKQPGESDRVFSLRRQNEIAKAALEARKPKDASTHAPVPQPRQEVAAPSRAPQGVPFGEPEPEEADFVNEANPLRAYTKAVAAWEFKRQLHEAQQTILANRARQSQQQAMAQSEQLRNDLNARLNTYAQSRPEFWAKLDKVDKPELSLPHVMVQAIVSDLDTAPQIMEYLADHEDELEDAISFSAPFGDDLSAPSVALVRRRLNRILSRGTDVRKGASSPAPAPVLVAPRPPTPLGTGPLKTGDEPPGDDDMSLANHEKFFGRNRRNGRR